MSKPGPSERELRLDACRSRLVLDLFTRHGAFWSAVAALRKRWEITAAVAVPPDLPAQLARPWDLDLHHPPTWPAELPPSPLPEPLDAEFIEEAPLPGLRPEDEAEQRWRRRWYADLWRLHDACVPDECRPPEPASAPSWASFLSACVVYDPPRAELLRFVKAAPPCLDLSSEALTRPVGGSPEPGDAPAMVHGPIVRVRDAAAVEAATVAYFSETLDLLHAALAARGVDSRALLAAELAAHPEVTERFSARLRRAAWLQYIDPTGAETTQADVLAAYRVLRGDRPPPRKKGRPPRDSLVCVQCAIWRDEEQRTHRWLARRFGWQVDRTGRCENARLHIRDGRAILRDRTRAAGT